MITTDDVQKRLWATHDRDQTMSLRQLELALAFAEAHPGGWSGSPTELADALFAVAVSRNLHRGVYSPRARAPQFLAGRLEQFGWRVAETRTRHARTVTVTPPA